MSVKYFSILCLALLSISCTNKYIDEIERGAGYEYQPGFPEIRLVASSFIDEQDSTKLNVAVELVYGSMVYGKEDNQFVATGVLNIELVNTDPENGEVKRFEYPISIKREDDGIIYSQETYLIEKEYAVPPGNYTVNATMTDDFTEKETNRTHDAFIPDPNQPVSNITNIWINAKDNESALADYAPSTTYDINNDVDSVKFLFQVTNNDPENPITIETQLLKFRSDTSVARRMNYNNYSPSSIYFRGIDFDRSETINSSRRVLNEPGSVLIEYTFSDLDRGNYRFQVTANPDTDAEMFKARDFSVKSKNYPAIQTPEELARPLIYLMNERDYDELMSIEDPDSLKAAVDRFWLSNIQNTSKARSTLSLYYERVEEANKLFSNYKEGWKTDRGMIYILFGNPWYADRTLNELRWSYSHNLADPERNFYFFTPKIRNKYFPFHNYILRRSDDYYNVNYQQIQLWLSGNIISNDI